MIWKTEGGAEVDGKATRSEVYSAINTERNYQDTLSRKGIKSGMAAGHVASPASHAAVIRRILRDFEDYHYDNSSLDPNYNTMQFFRKIAATAVRAMEQHGAPHRA